MPGDDTPVGRFITGMRTDTRPHKDGQLIVSAVVGGGTRITGPRRVSCRAVAELADKCGVSWSIVCDTAATRPTITVEAGAGWTPPAPVAVPVNSNPRDAVLAWAASTTAVRTVATVHTGRVAGSIIQISFVATGVLAGAAVVDALALPGVVNVFATAGGFTVYVARDTHVSGGLRHLCAQRLVRPRPSVAAVKTTSSRAARRRRPRGTRRSAV